jgi:hypothetical protein
MFERIGSDDGMPKMNRIECAAKQSYFSFRHEKLTTKLCVIEKKYNGRNQKLRPTKVVNKQ